MPDFIREGGWPMFPTLSFGLVALTLAIWHASRPGAGQRSLALTFAVLTLIMGLFGTVLGVQISCAAIRGVAPDQRWIFLIGLSESLQNLLSALALLLPTTIAVGVGDYRRAQDEEAGAE